MELTKRDAQITITAKPSQNKGLKVVNFLGFKKIPVRWFFIYILTNVWKYIKVLPRK